MSDFTLELSKPILLDDEGKVRITSVRLKEPTGGQYLDNGEPRILAQNADGTMFWVEDKTAIRAYLSGCVDHGNAGHVLRLMSIRDIRALREGLFGFFSAAPASPKAAQGGAPSTP